MIDYNPLITAGVAILGSVITGSVTYYRTKRKYNSEVDNTVIKNMQESLEFYKKLSDDNKERLEEVLKRNEILEQKNDALEKEIRELRNQMFEFMNCICTDLTCEIRKNKNIKKNGISTAKKDKV